MLTWGLVIIGLSSLGQIVLWSWVGLKARKHVRWWPF